MPGGPVSQIDLVTVFRRYGIDLVKRGGRLWALCPLHTERTPSCEVNPQKGLWHCFGCGEGGDAAALVMKREKVTYPEALAILGIEQYSARNTTARAGSKKNRTAREVFAGVDPNATPTPAPSETDEDRQAIDAARRMFYGHCIPLDGTPAAWYCEARGVPAIVAAASGARYCPDYMHGGPALVFPVKQYLPGEERSSICAIQGRYLYPATGGTDRPDKKTRGRMRGVFCTVGAIRQEYVIVTEAPMDSLSLAVCGFPSIALLGTHAPEWLPGAIGARRAYLATDNDSAGDGAAVKLCDALAAKGGKVYRLKPEGVKDWNEYLCTFGPVIMEAAILAASRIDRPPVNHLPAVDLARTLPAGTAIRLPDGSAAAVVSYHSPDEQLPAGWVEVETHDGRRGEVDCRDARHRSGAALVPYPVLTWRERIARAKAALENRARMP